MQNPGVRKELQWELRSLLPARLPEFLAKQRWFGGKARQVLSTTIGDIIPMRRNDFEALWLMVDVRYAGGSEEKYSVPVVCVEGSAGVPADESVLLTVKNEESGTALVVRDASKSDEFLRLLLEAIQRKAAFRGEGGELHGSASADAARLAAASEMLKPRHLVGEQSNTSVIYGDRLILKFFRLLEEGINPDLEIGRFLSEKTHFAHVPQLAGYLEYRAKDGEQMTQGILQAFVPNQGDAWRCTLRLLPAFYEAVRRRAGAGGEVLALERGTHPMREIPEFARAALEPHLSAAALLGQRTAELHLALAADTSDPAFAPEPFTMQFQQQLRHSLVELVRATFQLLCGKLPQLPAEWRRKAKQVVGRKERIVERFDSILNMPIHALRTRIHGDYHLGQALYTGSDFVIIDFEGEPARPLVERRSKRSPLQDVASMMRSFHYAAFAPLLGASGDKPARDELSRLAPWAEAWGAWVTNRFLAEYFKTSGSAAYLPSSRGQTKSLLDLHLLEKAIYELTYELNNRPKWVGIPLEGIVRLLSAERG